jgi:hypothetical protein
MPSLQVTILTCSAGRSLHFHPLACRLTCRLTVAGIAMRDDECRGLWIETGRELRGRVWEYLPKHLQCTAGVVVISTLLDEE